MLAKEDRFDLKATVLTLAMLSPTTVMAVAVAFNPETPEYKEPIILPSLLLK